MTTLTCPQPTEEVPKNSPIAKRGPGRPKKIVTGKPGRPAKQYIKAGTKPAEPSIEPEAHTPTVAQDGTSNDISETIYDLNDDVQPDVDLVMFASEIPFSEAISGPDSQDWKEAILSEIKSLIANDTWEIVDKPSDAKIIGSRIVLRNKYTADGAIERRKARVVARGFVQRPGIDFHDTFSPVARLDSLRLLTALSAESNMEICQLDITTAYLNGDVDTELYMEPPKLLRETLEKIIQANEDKALIEKANLMLSNLRGINKVCRLKRALYGLRQAGRQWHSKLDSFLKEIGLSPTNADPCIYTDLAKQVFLLVYVDDILIASNDKNKSKKLQDELSRRFVVRNLGLASYCLGIEIHQGRERIQLSQSGYISEVLKRFGMEDCKAAQTPIASGFKLTEKPKEGCDETNYPYRELIGALMYLAMGTRPDIAHAVNSLSQFNHCHGRQHWLAAKRILRYLKGTVGSGLRFKRTSKKLTGYVDADWGNCTVDRRSYTGYAFVLAGGAISWESRKQRTVALSSTEAEYMAITSAAKEAIHLIGFLKELGFENLSEVTLYNDNQGAGNLATNPIHHSRSKHIDIRYHFIREVLKTKSLRLEYLPTEDMTADILTKGLNVSKNEKCTEALGIINIGRWERSN